MSADFIEDKPLSIRLGTAARRPLVVANWKMNGNSQSNAELLRQFTQHWQGVHYAEVAICAPYVYLPQALELLSQSNVIVGAQDLSHFSVGAYTGEISASMLADIGCEYVIVGHSERRNYFAESDTVIAEKFMRAQAAGLTPIFCVGESLQKREAGDAHAAIGAQLQGVIDVVGRDAFKQAIIAYEPIWAVGTGRIATPEQVSDMHAFIRKQLGDVGTGLRILYGGSVTADNAAQTFALEDVDGALVGGASLKADNFFAICQAAELVQSWNWTEIEL